jgi:hypothetical protein
MNENTTECMTGAIGDDFVTGQEIAKLFKVSNSTVNLWKRQGMPFYGRSSCARFLKSDVVTWQRQQSQLPVEKRVRKPAEAKVELETKTEGGENEATKEPVAE